MGEVDAARTEDLELEAGHTSNTCETSVPTTSEVDMVQSADSWSGPKKLLKQALPLIALVGLNLFYQNTIYIVLFLSLVFVFDNVNDVILQQIMLQDQRSIRCLLLLCGYLFFMLYLMLPTVQNFWFFDLFEMIRWSTTPCSFWHVLFNVAVVDFIVKFVTITAKAGLTLPGAKVVPREKLGGILMMFEAFSQLIRCLMPTPEWVKYIVLSSSCFATVICWVFALLYIFLKFTALKSKLHLLRSGWNNYKDPPMKCWWIVVLLFSGMVDRLNRLVFGNHLLESSAPNTPCPLCHRKYTDPVQLSCRHVFCHSCCYMWFDRDRECPVCSSNATFAAVMGQSDRLSPSFAVTTRSSQWKTGTTEYLVQLF